MGKRALISVFNKEKIVGFAQELSNMGYEIISSSGTAKALKENRIKVTEVSAVTGFPEIMGGRVKTLHPKIHGGLLAVRDNKEYMRQLKDNQIAPIDIVAVNLYPFEQVVTKGGRMDEIIENIDIGGPAMVRAAAKNHRFAAVVIDPEDYQKVIDEIKKEGSVTMKTKKMLALKAFQHTAFYDAVIASVLKGKFGAGDKFHEELTIPVRKKTILRYGENPHQEAALYTSPTDTGMSIAESEVLQGKAMSYNNFLDTEAAVNLVREFDGTAVVIVKHLNPCGIVIGKTQVKAYETTLSLDPKSAFGGIVAFNGEVDEKTAQALTKIFLEVIAAPGYSKKALEILATKKNLRVVKIKNFNRRSDNLECRKISGGLLVQDRDSDLYKTLTVVSKRKPSKSELKDLVFAFTVVKHVKSNSVVIAKNNKTVGIGPGQTSRVDSLEIAVKKAKEFGQKVNGSVLASEAFFPFKDSIQEAAKHGIRAIIQPGGSLADKEVIEEADKHKIAMVFTGMRHFRH
jgi:phosphoribosylaminoimidazolecarboxamide formyltransferase/IMP cyclohydrolase